MISPSVGDRYSSEYAAFLADAELAILRTIADSLARGIDAPGWEQQQLARIQSTRADVLAVLRATRPRLVARLNASLEAAYTEGQLSAYADAHTRAPALERITEQARGAMAATANQLANGFDEASAAILRTTDDVYRRVVGQATAAVVAGRERRVDAVQRILGDMTRGGLRGIVDAAGRQWTLGTYTTMAVRTATARAAIAGHEAGMDTLGLDLVIVHPGPRACATCDRWARMILARNGRAGTFEVRSLTGPGTITVEVGGTLAEARSRGWGHPNCRCGLGAYIPGATDPAVIKRPPHDEAGYQAQQQQRANERQIRAWRQREATALTPEAQREAADQVKRWQGRQRDHLAEHDYLKRQYGREGIGRGQDGNPEYARAITREKRRGDPDAPPSTTVPKPPPEPPSTTPKLDRLPRLAAPEDPTDAATRTNPRLRLDPGYQVNCSYVVNAVELRARGRDVIARARPGGRRATGRTNFEMAADWLRADGTRPAWTPLGPGTTVRNVHKRLAEATDDWPVGARGFVSGQWKGERSGHVWNVERTADGLRHIEGQVHDVTPDQAGAYLDRMRGTTVQVMRTDNLDPTDALDEAVEARSDEADRATAAALAAELAAARAELADLRTLLDDVRAQTERALDAMIEATDGAERIRAANNLQRLQRRAQTLAAQAMRQEARIRELER